MSAVKNALDQLYGQRSSDPIKLDSPVPVQMLPTPALVIDLNLFEENINKMQTYLNEHGIGLRCHAKMHKCPVIARKQLEQGAVGICTATVSEAEAMVSGGVTKILVTSPIVTQDKVDRLMDIRAASEHLGIVVDHEEGARLLNRSAVARNLTLDVYIDLDPGLGRTGIEAGKPALQLARTILNDLPGLRLSGLQMYAGHCMHVQGFEDRLKKYHDAMKGGLETRERFEKEGIAIPVFSGGGTGTFDMEAELGLVNELQAGSYPFMDVEYRNIGGMGTELFESFEPSLFVLVTAISKPQKKLITVDAGFKSFASDTVVPEFRDIEGLKYHWGGDEHGIVLLNNPSREVRLADKMMMVTSHCDPTVNLYDYYFPYRNGMVEEIWPITARGKSQ